MWNTRLLAVAVALAALSPCFGDSTLSRFVFRQPHMGTWFEVTLYAPDQGSARHAVDKAFARVAELDRMMTDYNPDSELMRLCKKTGPVRVSKELFFVLDQAQEVARRSGGAFDITVGPLVRLWRRARRTGLLPDPAQVAEARKVVGYELVRLDESKQTVELQKPGMRLDLGGIAKGYAADEALRVLKQEGIASALVAAGGDVAAGAAPPGLPGWKVAIARLGDDPDHPAASVTLSRAAVSTSGDREQFVELQGKRYSHIIDPRTAMPLVTPRTATVIAPDGVTADALTKVASVLEPSEALRVIATFPGASTMIVRQGPAAVETIASRKFPVLKETAGNKR